MARILIYNGTTPEWIVVDGANVTTVNQTDRLSFDAVINLAEEFTADTEDGAAKRQQLADLMAANVDMLADLAVNQQLINNLADNNTLMSNIASDEGFISDIASDLVANHLSDVKGPAGESFQIDDSGELTVGIAAGIMAESGAASTDFYLYLVTVDNRNLADLEEGLEGIDAANQNTLDDLSRHVIMWDGQSWHDYGQFTALQGPTGAQGEQGIQGEQGLIGPTGPGILDVLNYAQTEGNDPVTGINTVGQTVVSQEITTTGGPIQIIATGDSNPQVALAWVRLQLFRDDTAIGKIIHVEASTNNENTSYTLNYIDEPEAGTYTYSVRTVDGINGTHNFGESSGNHMTLVELKGVKGDQGDAGLSGSVTINSFQFEYSDDSGLADQIGKIYLDSTSNFTNIETIELNIIDNNNLSIMASQNIKNNQKYQISIQDVDGNYGVYTTNPRRTFFNSYSYRGFKVAMNRIWGDDPSINQLIIYNENDYTVATVDGNTSYEDFKITGLTNNSSIVAAINIFGSSSQNPISANNLIDFFNTFVDNVIYNGDSLNDIATIKSNFYTNFSNLTEVLPQLYEDFDFSPGYGSNYIDDGDDDQYDSGNYINTNLKSKINYGESDENGQGEIQSGYKSEIAFGVGSNYVTLYQDSIFAMIATGANITSLGYIGNLGADGDGAEHLAPLGSIEFDNIQYVKSEGSLNTESESLIICEIKLIDTANEVISTWNNADSSFSKDPTDLPNSIWNIETYNDGGVFNLVGSNGGTPIAGDFTMLTYDTQEAVSFIRIAHSDQVLDLIDHYLNPNDYITQFSVDGGNTWVNYNNSIGYSQPNFIYYDISVDQNVTFNTEDTVLYRQVRQSSPIIWWDCNNTPTWKYATKNGLLDPSDEGDYENPFRGAIINYHALTDDGTIIGTIHISRDWGGMPQNIIHTESKSGNENIDKHDLWYSDEEGVLKYRYNDEGHDDKKLRIHWTSTVFNGFDYADG
jgi:hypothetical protein